MTIGRTEPERSPFGCRLLQRHVHEATRRKRDSRTGRPWDEVEREIEAIDWRDLAEFLEADRGPFEPCAEFRENLRRELQSFVRQGRRA